VQGRTEVSGKPVGPVLKGPSSALPFKMKPVGCFETSVRKYRFTLRKIHSPLPPPPKKSPVLGCSTLVITTYRLFSSFF